MSSHKHAEPSKNYKSPSSFALLPVVAQFG